MKKRIFWKVFLLLLLAVVLVFSAGVFTVHHNSRKIIKERLTVEAKLLSAMIVTKEDITQLDAYKNKEEFRITVISGDGTVLYESSMDGKLDNHGNREEVIGALAGKPQTVTRYSDTFGCNMTYYAVRSTLDNGEVVVLRLAVRSSEISAYLTVVLPFMLLVLVLALVISGFLANKLSKSLAMKINEVAVSLASLNDGAYEPIQTDSREPEFYAVFRQINELNERTLHHIRKKEEEKEKLNAVLDNVAQSIIALDMEGNIAFCNNSADRLFGGAGQAIGKQPIFLIAESALCHRIEKTENDVFEYTYGEKELLVAVRAIADGKLKGTLSSIVIITDITREKGIAKEKSEFFANASHELKTPITVMQGMAELMLAKEDLDAASKRQVERIHKEAVRMAELIADMLRLGDLENPETELPILPVELRFVAEEVLGEFSEVCAAKNIRVQINGEGRVQADPKKIHELVENIVSNAVHYNKENGSILVDITQVGDRTVLAVTDTGIGIEKVHIPHLCKRFYRVDKSRSKKTGGTGLGLAIVKHICALYDAKLCIESEIGQGTRVTVSF